MTIWQADFYPLSDSRSHTPIWELLVCDANGQILISAQCPQAEARASWITEQLKPAITESQPQEIQIFRPQALGLITQGAQPLSISVRATRR
ncbi:MAG: Tab2/Atab2 family RNA-binding protein, partial [Cyanobacteria bacterium P01_H01_bin.15]